jgi:hypothetical protein
MTDVNTEVCRNLSWQSGRIAAERAKRRFLALRRTL